MAQTVKHLPAIQGTQVQFLGPEDPPEKEMAIHSSLLPGKSHGQRSLIGYSPWGTTSQVALVVKNLPANAGDIRDLVSIPGLRRSPGGGHGN